MDDPSWIKIARGYLGVAEIPGKKDHPTIVRWLKTLKAAWTNEDAPWCGTFVGGVLDEDGKGYVKNPWGARNWLKFGKPLDRPALGALVIFWRGSPGGWSGHVGFIVGKDERGNLMVLGGNQGDKVSIAPFSKARVLGYRWPSQWPNAERFNLPVLDSRGQFLSTNEA